MVDRLVRCERRDGPPCWVPGGRAEQSLPVADRLNGLIVKGRGLNIIRKCQYRTKADRCSEKLSTCYWPRVVADAEVFQILEKGIRMGQVWGFGPPILGVTR